MQRAHVGIDGGSQRGVASQVANKSWQVCRGCSMDWSRGRDRGWWRGWRHCCSGTVERLQPFANDFCLVVLRRLKTVLRCRNCFGEFLVD